MTAAPHPLAVALDVVSQETLALFRADLATFIETARADWPQDVDGELTACDSALAMIDRAAYLAHAFGPWDAAAFTWTGATMNPLGVVASRPVVAWWNAERRPDSYLERFPESARPFCDRAYQDGQADAASEVQSFADDIRAALDMPPHQIVGAIRAALEDHERLSA